MPEESLLKGVLYSLFDDEGPSPRFVFPADLDYGWQLQIAMKTISLMMGERVYQDGDRFDDVKYFGILPFPDFGLDALTFFFLLRDENARGQAKAATITLLAAEKHRNFLYEDMQYLQSVLHATALKVHTDLSESRLAEIFNELIQEINEYLKNKASPLGGPQKYKLLFSGLDNAGKTSFLLGIQQKYSELLGIAPTRGLTQSRIDIFGTQLFEWEVGGQKHYRDAILSSGVILYDTDALFYLVDAQDPDRLPESVEFFQALLEFMGRNDIHGPIVVCFHKIDPDVRDDPAIRAIVQQGEEMFKSVAEPAGRSIKFFETSVFDHWSLVLAFSYGVSRLSPNRDVFRLQLEWLGERIAADDIFLMNEGGLILSDYVRDEQTSEVLEAAAPYVFSLFKTFKRGGTLQADRIIWKLDDRIGVMFQVPVKSFNIFLMLLLPSEENIALLDADLGEFCERIEGLISDFL
ncbi:MAG TPA: ADP-ribosylation factor-like protein [Candidatus Lokiarchaeia archaeon]|nr:ADP-ribosylation factor-like protein [Candidatus Lokiarchaeia archaeon]